MLFTVPGVLVVTSVDFRVVVNGVVVIEASNVVKRSVDFALMCFGLTDTAIDSGVDDTSTR